MPLTRNRPACKRKKDGKPHKDKEQTNIILPYIPLDISLIRADLITEYFNFAGIDPNDLAISGMQYLSPYYSPKENKIYLYAEYPGSGWTGSPTEFMTWGGGWERVDISLNAQSYLPFIESREGALLGYNIFEVPKVYSYYEF